MRVKFIGLNLSRVEMADPPIVADCADETASQEPDDDRVTMTKSSRKRRTNAEIAAANEAELQHLKQMDTSGWTVKDVKATKLILTS